MDHGPQLIPDWTIFIQLGLFCASYLVMKKLLFEPYLRLIQIREHSTEGFAEEAKKKSEVARQYQEKYEAKLQEVRRNVGLEIEKRKRELQEKERKEIGELTKISVAAREKVRHDLREMTNRLISEIEPQIPVFSSEISEKILGRKFQSHDKSINPSLELE